jgi:hypothetical protein
MAALMASSALSAHVLPIHSPLGGLPRKVISAVVAAGNCHAVPLRACGRHRETGCAHQGRGSPMRSALRLRFGRCGFPDLKDFRRSILNRSAIDFCKWDMQGRKTMGELVGQLVHDNQIRLQSGNQFGIRVEEGTCFRQGKTTRRGYSQ